MGEKEDRPEILVGLGANLRSAFGTPRQTLLTAINRLSQFGLQIAKCSSFWNTRPVPVSDQPWFVNAVIALGTAPPPVALLAMLHEVEREFGRSRGVVNQARTLDLDLLAYGRLVIGRPDLVVPHPRLCERAFVLIPLREVAPGWRHPVTGEDIDRLIACLPPNQGIRREE